MVNKFWLTLVLVGLFGCGSSLDAQNTNKSRPRENAAIELGNTSSKLTSEEWPADPVVVTSRSGGGY